MKEAGQGSGGRFATGDYVSGRRRLELHFRRSLGFVTYHLDGSSVSHEGLMRALGAAGRHEYPGFSDDPLDGFRHLQRDIECYGQVFLTGSDDDFSHVLAEAQRLEALRPKGIAGTFHEERLI